MLLITCIVVFIVDVSGFVNEMKDRYAAALRLPDGSRMSWKPFDCSLCVTFWAGVVLCCLEGFTIQHAAFVCLCAFLARFVENCYLLIREFLAALTRFLMDKIEKL